MQRERDLQSASWPHQDVVPGQPSSKAYPNSTEPLLREGCSTSVSQEDQRVVLLCFLTWTDAVLLRVRVEQEPTSARRCASDRVGELVLSPAHAVQRAQHRGRAEGHPRGQGILGPALIPTALCNVQPCRQCTVPMMSMPDVCPTQYYEGPHQQRMHNTTMSLCFLWGFE